MIVLASKLSNKWVGGYRKWHKEVLLVHPNWASPLPSDCEIFQCGA